jgi:hypothetical protein
LLAWGNRHFAPEGPAVQIVNNRTGAVVEPILVDGATGERLAGPDFTLAPGPGQSRARRNALTPN